MSVTARRDLDRRIARLAVPAVAALLTEPLYDLCDTAILGHLGSRQLAAAAVATRILAFGYALFVFLLFATTATVARARGSGEPVRSVEAATTATLVAGGIGTAAGAVIAVAGPSLIALMGPDARTAGDAWTYLWISLLGLPASLVVMVGVGYHRGIERPTVPLVVAAASVALNLVAELTLILGLGFGVGASAASTVAARWVAACVHLALLRRDAARHHARWWAPKEVAALLHIAWPLVLRTASLLLTLALATNLAGRFGTDAVAAHSVAFAIWAFAAAVSDGTESAAQALVAHHLGAGDGPGARRAIGRVLWWAGWVGGALGLLIWTTRTELASLATDDRSVARAAADALRWVAALQPVAAVTFTLDGVLVGSGRQRVLAPIMFVATAGFLVATAATDRLLAELDLVWFGLAVFMALRVVPAAVVVALGDGATQGSDRTVTGS